MTVIIILICALFFFAFVGKGMIKIVAQMIILVGLLMFLGIYSYLRICNVLSDIIETSDWIIGGLIAIVWIYYSGRVFWFVCRKIFGKKEIVVIENKDDSRDKEIG